MGIQLSAGVENIVGKGEIAIHEQFLLFHNIFKSSLLLMCDYEYLWSKGLKHFGKRRKMQGTEKNYTIGITFQLWSATALTLSQTSPCFYLSAVQVF